MKTARNRIQCRTPWTPEVMLEWSDSERIALVGPSGCGKTTFLKAMLGLVPEARGTWWFRGQDLGALPTEKRALGFLPQQSLLFPHLTVEGNVALGLRARGVSKKDLRYRVDSWLDAVGMSGRGGDQPDRLSGGEARRIALARALVWEPEFLLLDEPWAGLDPESAQRLADLVRTECESRGVGLMMVSHDAADRRRLATREFAMPTVPIATP